ncbi:MAG: type II toxin-antitoxin system prevent-host-death family antitoxin [Verrucomicrobia bacterium]|nr:type II toxin-antitoxin system prevent-host-death family antitoxin [Verrucomicrobiota bacterium]
MKTVNVQHAKTQLSRLLEEAAAGETIIIGKAGKPMAMLVAWRPELKKRQLGGWRNQVWIADDFDVPSPEIESLFLGQKPRRQRSRKPRRK